MSFTPVNKADKKTDEDIQDRYDEVAAAIDGLSVKVKESQIDPEFIKKHPPVDGYMGVQVKKAELKSVTDDNTELVEPCLIQPLDSTDKDLKDMGELPEGEYYLLDTKTNKKHKVAIWDTVFKTDLRTLIMSQLYECPATVFPVIAERLEETARKERELKFPDNRSEKKDYFWLFFFIMIMVLVVIAFTVL